MPLTVIFTRAALETAHNKGCGSSPTTRQNPKKWLRMGYIVQPALQCGGWNVSVISVQEGHGLHFRRKLTVTAYRSKLDVHVIYKNTAVSSLSAHTARLRLICDGTRAETIFRLSAKRTSPFKSAGASVQSATGSRGVRISCSNAGYTMFRGSVKSTGYPLHSAVSPSLPLQCVTVCHHISTGLYL